MAATPPVCDFDAPAPDFDLPATDGRRYSRDAVRGPSGLLVMFICNHCPFVKAVIDKIVRDAGELFYFLRDVAVGKQAVLEVNRGQEKRNVTVNFPADYRAAELAGKQAIFATEVKSVEEPVLPEIDEEFCKSFGVTEGGLPKLREDVAANMRRELFDQRFGDKQALAGLRAAPFGCFLDPDYHVIERRAERDRPIARPQAHSHQRHPRPRHVEQRRRGNTQGPGGGPDSPGYLSGHRHPQLGHPGPVTG